MRTHTTDVIIGLSGGIDSSVVAALACEVLGPAHVHGYLLPGPFSSDHSLNDALLLAQNLNMHTETVSITPAYDAFVESFSVLQDKITGVALENTQARCRMVVLMAIANEHEWLVLNTGNRSEAMMGYSTLYGDTVGAFAPIGGVYKTDVFAVARHINEKAMQADKVPPIPQNILTKPPSAELAPNQTDEATLGSYEALDAVLKLYLEEGKNEHDITDLGFDEAEVTRIIRRMQHYEFKRNMEPPYAHISYGEAAK